ncbi:hypothetical protein [Microbacterium sp. 8M]|uniref:hypothetical protein n=1 Tax=Microbacterium sp. 8M TaxID=2653153 RepID=UPI001356A3FE|nr:hypothetical protein [Microbacterium sp. 8M]
MLELRSTQRILRIHPARVELEPKRFEALFQRGELWRDAVELGTKVGEVGLIPTESSLVVPLRTVPLLQKRSDALFDALLDALIGTSIDSVSDRRVQAAAKAVEHTVLTSFGFDSAV